MQKDAQNLNCVDIDNDENEDCNDDCELQIAYDTELIELGFLDEDDE